MADYHYVTTWRIKVPIERVWEEISHLERWPSWWKYVVRVVKLEPGAADGVGKRQRVLLRARLPSYTLGFDTRITRVQPPTALEAEATGGLEGTGRWALAPDDGGTLVRYTWDVRTTGWLMNLLAPVARPVFDWNHDQLMREGGQGLARRLGVELDLPDAPVRRRLGAAGWAVGAAAVVALTVLGRRRRAARR
jgi:carbon monoxide dehydrogenase subunit G